MVNPYESPQANDGEVDLEGKPAPLPHFTHITVNGCNLLGLLSAFAFIGYMVVDSTILPDIGAIRLILLFLVVAGLTAADIAMRLRFGRGGWIRLLIPHAGGTLFLIPIWAAYIALTVTCLTLFLSPRY